MKLKCAIVDDEPLALGLLESYAKKTPLLELCGCYSSAIEAMKHLMPDLNGLEYSRMVDEQTRIVFTTAFDQYAIDGYRVNALDYLLKPISYADFMQAVNKAVQWFELKQKADEAPQKTADSVTNFAGEYIYVKSDYKLVQIELEPRPILSLISMRAMEEKLPADRFIRVHRSFIVQKQKIKVIDKGRIVFGKEYIPISDSYKQELQNYVNKHTI